MKTKTAYRRMAAALLASGAALLSTAAWPTQSTQSLSEVSWIHGSADCATNTDPAIQIVRYDNSSYVLRQNKCLSYEAPFIYLLVGDERVLVLDTGATASPESFPLYDTVRSIVGDRELLVLHSHSHRDHYAGDAQFAGKAEVDLVEPNSDAVAHLFRSAGSPENELRIDLGNRELIILSAPGHQEEAIAIYDPRTRWLLTGDTVYPGVIYVKDPAAYRDSISRLAAFATDHEVSAVLGAHIESTVRAKEHYPIGTVFQPEEAGLPLDPAVLQRLDTALAEADLDEAVQLDELMIQPMNTVQKTLSNLARFFTQ